VAFKALWHAQNFPRSSGNLNQFLERLTLNSAEAKFMTNQVYILLESPFCFLKLSSLFTPFREA